MAENFMTGMGRSRRGTGGPDPPPQKKKKKKKKKLSQKIGFLSNTGPNPLKIAQILRQISMLGHHRDASETPFNDPLLVVF